MQDVLPILVRNIETAHDSKGVFESTASVVLEHVPVEKLKGNLTALCGLLGETLRDVWEVGQFQLCEVTVQVEVHAGGKVTLVGVGGDVGGKGALTLKFTKPI